MGRKKIDNRIRVLIENGVKLGHRTLFVVVGDKSKDQVIKHVRIVLFVSHSYFNAFIHCLF